MKQPLILTSCALALGLPLQAQGEQTEPVRPAATQAVEQAELRLARAAIGPEAVLRDASGERVGTIADHVIDARGAAQIRYVAVQTSEETTVLVPYEQFRWSEAHGELRLDLEAEALAECEPFDARAFRAPVPEEGVDAEMPKQPQAHRLASDLLMATVLAKSEPIGRIGGLVFEPGSGSVPLVLVERQETLETPAEPTLVPWQALEAVADEEGTYAVPMAKRHVASAPRLKRSDLRTLEREALRHVFEFWGVETPARFRASS